MRDLADKAQVCTQRSWKRPYGVGLLVGGFDKTGAKLYYNCPSGNYYEYKANAVGARSQARVYSTLELMPMHVVPNFCLPLFCFCWPVATNCMVHTMHLVYAGLLSCCSSCLFHHLQAARTYLERKFEDFEGCSLDQLIRHSLQVWPHIQHDGCDVLNSTMLAQLVTCISS